MSTSSTTPPTLRRVFSLDVVAVELFVDLEVEPKSMLPVPPEVYDKFLILRFSFSSADILLGELETPPAFLVGFFESSGILILLNFNFSLLFLIAQAYAPNPVADPSMYIYNLKCLPCNVPILNPEPAVDGILKLLSILRVEFAAI